MKKKMITILISVFVLLIVGVVCIYGKSILIDYKLEKITSTNLEKITIDGFAIGSNVNEVDISKYKKSDRYLDQGDFNYDEFFFDIESNNLISKIFAKFDNGNVDIVINEMHNIKIIDQIEKILGDNYIDCKYDSSQSLNVHMYYDKINDVVVEFVYVNTGKMSENNRKLCWIEIYYKN